MYFQSESVGTSVAAIQPLSKKGRRNAWRRIAGWCIGSFGVLVVGYWIYAVWLEPEAKAVDLLLQKVLTLEFVVFVLCGFAAQMVDGALGLGYGLTCTTALLATGAPPAMVSSSIHTAEVFTTGASGYSHYRFGNVNKRLVWALLWPAMAGAIAGSLLLVFIGSRYAAWTSLLLGVYCFFLAAKILLQAARATVEKRKIRHLHRLAAAGGFFDAFGGGGWGPLVTSSLIAKGRSPRYVVGSVSLVEFFITLATAVTFFAALGISYWNVVLGLVIGGTVAAPFAAKLAGKLPRRTGMIVVGGFVMIWSIYLIVKILPAVW